MLRCTLEQWRMFHAVVEHGGFNQAAQAIHKSQSSIHHAVQKLEDSLALKLFKIEGKKTVLTEPGELMLRRSRYLVEEAEKIEAIAGCLDKGVETYLRIAVDEVFPQALLYLVLDKVSKKFPLLRIELSETILSGANELLEEGSVDIAITGYPITHAHYEELCNVEFVAVAAPEHELHHLDRVITREDLKIRRQVVVRDSARGQSVDDGWLEANQRWTVSHMRTSIDMIRQGFGFAWLPKEAIQEDIELGKLKALQLEQNGQRHAQLYLMYLDIDRFGPAARSFITELKNQCDLQ